MNTPKTSGYALLPALLLATLAARGTAQVTVRCSVSSAGDEANGGSYHCAISQDGRFVAFESYASNLVPGDTNDTKDVFVHDRMTRTTTRVSVDSSGAEGNDRSSYAALSADGRYVAFTSDASNLVPGDTNGYEDVFLHDREGGKTIRVSVSSTGVEGNHESLAPALSADGGLVVFQSYASNLVKNDTNGRYDVFLHDVASRKTIRLSVDSSGTEGNASSWLPTISADGRVVAFRSYASNLVSSDNNGCSDVFVHDRLWRSTTRVSVDSNGTEANAQSMSCQIAASGNVVVFASEADNLVPGDTNGVEDVFLHSLSSGTTERISVSSAGAEGNGTSTEPSISADGSRICFTSHATNLVPGDGNGSEDAFLRDLCPQTTHRVSVATSGTEGDRESVAKGISGDGRFAAFYSYATNLVGGDTNADVDVFVHGPELTLEIVPPEASLGDTVVATTWYGRPGEPALLFLQQVDSTPVQLRVAIGTFDVAYLWPLSGDIPNNPSLGGLDLVFQSFALGPVTRKVQVTNRELLSIR